MVTCSLVLGGLTSLSYETASAQASEDVYAISTEKLPGGWLRTKCDESGNDCSSKWSTLSNKNIIKEEGR